MMLDLGARLWRTQKKMAITLQARFYGIGETVCEWRKNEAGNKYSNT